MPVLLIFGGGGQVAAALPGASPPGWDVRALGRDAADITRPAEVAAALDAARPAAVVNAAAYTAVDRAESEPERAVAANRDGARIVAEACAERGLRLIHLSTDYVFDGRKAGPYREDDPVAPLGAYGRSKAEGEAAVRAAGGRHVILRTSWVYGPVGQNFVRTMLRLGRERPELRVVDDQSGSPTSTADLADAILVIARRLAEGEGAGTGTFHFCGGGVTTWYRFAQAIFDEAARRGYPPPRLTPIATADYPTAARRPANSALDCSRIARVYGIRPRPWREALGRCIDRIAASGDLA